MGIPFRLYTLSLPDGRGKKVDCEENGKKVKPKKGKVRVTYKDLLINF